jgi:hypothetical protein
MKTTTHRFVALYTKFLYTCALMLLFGFGFFSSVQAATLTVTPETDPLFTIGNIIPGTTISKTMSVQNGTLDTHDVYLAVANVLDSGLAGGLFISVTDGVTTYFSGSFTDLGALTAVALGQLGAGGTKLYTLTVSLPLTAPSSLQGTSVGFDFLVGFSGTDSVVVVPGTGSRRGGRGGSFVPLTAPEPVDGVPPLVLGATDVLTTSTPMPQIAGVSDSNNFPLGAPNTGFGALYHYTTKNPSQSSLIILALSSVLGLIYLRRRFERHIG